MQDMRNRSVALFVEAQILWLLIQALIVLGRQNADDITCKNDCEQNDRGITIRIVIIMTDQDFKNQYWKQYIMIEKEFKTSIKYVAVDHCNFSTYSDVYAKLLLLIGSEVDVVAKEICKEINMTSTAEKISSYQPEICSRFPEFESVITACSDIDLHPWQGWSNSSPDWWKIYNGLKHNRNKHETYGAVTQENYKFANQGVVLESLAGLYQLEQYLYSFISHNPHEETPLPGSRLYRLKDQGWETKYFGQDSVLYIDDDGCLCTIFADPPYSDM